MNIDKMLTDIILKYQLDQYYPRFRKKVLGEVALEKWAREIGESQIMCVGIDQTDVDYFSHLFYHFRKEFSYCLYSQIMKGKEVECDCIVVISRRQNDGLIYWCRQYGKPVIFLYDYLELQGIYCEDDIYKITEGNYGSKLEDSFPVRKGWREAILMEFYIQRERIALAEDVESKCYYARKLFFLSLYIRNFIQAEKYQEMLAEMGDSSLERAWREVQALLTDIKQGIGRRTQNDIVMIWMDAVSYGSDKDMPFLQKQMKNGINYVNSFTVTPNTNPTALTLFRGKKLIDDELYLYSEGSITEENSPFLQDLRIHGYIYKVISGNLGIFDRKLRSRNYYELYVPCSVIFWDVLFNLLNAEKPVFLLAHALMEGHHPYLTTRMERDDFSSLSAMRHKGLLELDEQMEYYMSFVGREATRIFMSDHGQRRLKELFHTYFVVTGKHFRHREAKELFSYVDFPMLMHEILNGNALEQPLFDRKYAEVQALDRYNPIIVGNHIKNKTALAIDNFGYFGVITQDLLYLKYHIGREFLIQWKRMGDDPSLTHQAESDICDASMLPHFREIIGDRTVDISKHEKFRYTRYLYKVYENYLRKRGEVVNRVNQLFQKYSEKSIALRMGGEHSLELYRILTKENQKKIGYIIDRNQECHCACLGLPIISVDNIGGKGIKAVVLSSFDHLEELRREAQDYPGGIDILDIYESWEACGIHCGFYAGTLTSDEDYEVGFPFEEL